MSDTISTLDPTLKTVDPWFIQERIDAKLQEADEKRKQVVIDGLEFREKISHAYGRRPNGQRHGFGNGERFNSKRRRWAAKRQRAARNSIKNQTFNIFESDDVELDSI